VHFDFCFFYLFLCGNLKNRKGTVMAIMITEECINCGACEPECPNNAIYEGGAEWRFSDGTTVKGMYKKMDGTEIDADVPQPPVANDIYYIVTDKCTECVGFHDEPQCASVCPVDCCVDDPNFRESKEELLAKKEKMHV
jgi:ferredoxin